MVRKCITFLTTMLVLFMSVNETSADTPKRRKPKKSIVILFDNDVHCAIDGYTRMAGLRDAINNSDTAYAAIVSSGDFLQGGTGGALSRGEYIADIMHNMGYHAITLGNHEFDHGVPRQQELLHKIDAPIVCANFFNVTDTVPIYAPYIIQHYGHTAVAFVGVCTPEAMDSERYAFYDTEGIQHYDLRAKNIYELVQTATNQAHKEGANYVVVLSHLGETPDKSGISSHGMIAATTGIDAVLDGHTHSIIPHEEVLNRDGKRIPVCQTGSQFANVGQLLIKPHKKSISTMLIPMAAISESNSTVSTTTDSVKTEINKVATRQLGIVNYNLEIENEEGMCLVRIQETGLGDLVTDAFRHIMQAEIGLCNGGGIRNGIMAGIITYNDATNALPYDNRMVKVEATGADIRKMLETCTANLPYECGQFPQVSGMRYAIHQKSHTITDIEVLNTQTGTYQPLCPDRCYTIAVSDYYQNGGFNNTLTGCKLLQQTTLITRDAFADYITKVLKGNIGDAYAQPQGRITIVGD